MSERIPQSVAKRIGFRAYLASDGKTPATGKTIAITISKNGGAFGNPAAGATNATAISSGFYYFDLGTGDTDTQGPLLWRGAEGTIDDAGGVYEVVSAVNAGFTGIDDVPTNAELATALAAADDAVLAAVATVDTVVDAIKVKTDSLAFTVSGQVDANIRYVNNVAIGGTGSLGDEWVPA